jgi:cbb3-type cytochrome oxidase maturation protein
VFCLQPYFWHHKIQALSALYVLIGISLMVAGSSLIAFLWSVYNGQYEDDYTPSVRMLFDNNQESSLNSGKTPKQQGKNERRKIRLRQ